MRYFLVRDQNSYGPYDVAEIDAYLKAGNLVPTDRLESEDRTVRTTVADVLSFRAAPAPLPPTPSTGPASGYQGGGMAQGQPGMGYSPGGPAPGGNYQQPGGFQAAGPHQNVPNHLVFAILVTLFCCLPLGIVAIINATQVNSKLAIGDIQGAMLASKQARTWSIVGLCGGVVICVAYVAFVLISIAANS